MTLISVAAAATAASLIPGSVGTPEEPTMDAPAVPAANSPPTVPRTSTSGEERTPTQVSDLHTLRSPRSPWDSFRERLHRGRIGDQAQGLTASTIDASNQSDGLPGIGDTRQRLFSELQRAIAQGLHPSPTQPVRPSNPGNSTTSFRFRGFQVEGLKDSLLPTRLLIVSYLTCNWISGLRYSSHICREDLLCV